MRSDLSKVFFGCHAFDTKRDFVANVPCGVGSRDELFQALRDELRLPDYFGQNWDALEECLRDFHWIKARRVVIIHRDIPQLDARTLSTYLDILVECVQAWKPAEEHELFVVFPEDSRPAVLRIIDEIRRERKSN